MSHSSFTPATLYSYHDVCVCGSTGECQWVSKQFSDCSKEMVDNMTRDEGYKTCSTIFPGLKVTDVMDLVITLMRVHGYGVTGLTPLKGPHKGTRPSPHGKDQTQDDRKTQC